MRHSSGFESVERSWPAKGSNRDRPAHVLCVRPTRRAGRPDPFDRVSILLAIVTLGIDTYVWTWKTHDEIETRSGIGVGGPLGFVIYFVVSSVTWLYQVAGEVRNRRLTRLPATCPRLVSL